MYLLSSKIGTVLDSSSLLLLFTVHLRNAQVLNLLLILNGHMDADWGRVTSYGC